MTLQGMPATANNNITIKVRCFESHSRFKDHSKEKKHVETATYKSRPQLKQPTRPSGMRFTSQIDNNKRSSNMSVNGDLSLSVPALSKHYVFSGGTQQIGTFHNWQVQRGMRPGR